MNFVYLLGLLRAITRVLLGLSLGWGLIACSGGSNGPSKPLLPIQSSQSSSSSSQEPVTISGNLSYDFVPHNQNNLGLDYAATEARPIRGAIVELVDASGQVLAETEANANGLYQFTVAANTQVQVRVKAQLIQTQVPAWNISVNDNTRNNALYSMAGSLVSSGTTNSQRHLHAQSGWGANGYVDERVAAPFAIIDTLYQALSHLASAGLMHDLPAVQFRWSPANITAANPNDDYASGEIGTSFYDGQAVYLLGQADNDTDEYDAHIVLHEWIHYLEDVLARTDSLGGGHGYGDRLDMRVALSEGLANAMSAMLLDDPFFRDALGVEQSEGFFYDISAKNHIYRGWYNEASVESILYNYYISATDKTARNLTDILQVLTVSNYAETPAFISIFPFVHALISLNPGHLQLLESLLGEQLIYGTGIYGVDEINDGGETFNLPIYKLLQVNGAAVNVCSSSTFGKANKLGGAQFLRVAISDSRIYQVSVVKNGGDAVVTDPDFVLYRAGNLRWLAESVASDQEVANINLQAGQYVLEVYDYSNREATNANSNTTCFDVSIAP
jgi:hypothetical protein